MSPTSSSSVGCSSRRRAAHHQHSSRAVGYLRENGEKGQVMTHMEKTVWGQATKVLLLSAPGLRLHWGWGLLHLQGTSLHHFCQMCVCVIVCCFGWSQTGNSCSAPASALMHARHHKLAEAHLQLIHGLPLRIITSGQVPPAIKSCLAGHAASGWTALSCTQTNAGDDHCLLDGSQDLQPQHGTLLAGACAALQSNIQEPPKPGNIEGGWLK